MITVKELSEELSKSLAVIEDQDREVPEEVKLFWLHKNKDTGLVTSCNVVMNITQKT
jgi:hypothetical protein